ncbi:MAG: hypothetical protein NT062_26825 [Proteobacteria bacterium]|nr:hypothetical protein [Pseudomonadota bacterium]
MKLSRLALVVSLLSAGTALAQPGPDQAYDPEMAPQPSTSPQTSPQTQTVVVTGTLQVPVQAPVQAAASGAPINEPWSNVSNINGQIVPVGERSAYLFSQKKVNLSTNPIGWLMGFYGVSASYALSNNVAVRADVNAYSLDNTQGYEYGISLPIYLKRTYSGPFVEPGLAARGFSNSSDASCYGCVSGSTSSMTDVTYGPEVMVGWHSTFDSGLNIAAAVGAIRNVNPDRGEYQDQVEPTGYFRVGYAF